MQLCRRCIVACGAATPAVQRSWNHFICDAVRYVVAKNGKEGQRGMTAQICKLALLAKIEAGNKGICNLWPMLVYVIID